MNLTKEEYLLLIDMNVHKLKKSIFEFIPIKTNNENNENNEPRYIPVHKFFTTELLQKSEADLINKFILPNHGRVDQKIINHNTGYYQVQEFKKKDDIIDFCFFYQDFDLKDANDMHYYGAKLNEKKQELLTLINSLPLEANYIVESRNGFHVYYTIHPDDKSRLNSDWWHHVQYGIFDYIYNNITPTIDQSCKKSNQLLRLVPSFHRKEENNDLFRVHIIKVKDLAKKQDTVSQGLYRVGMFSHKIIDFMRAFNISTHLYNNHTPAYIIHKNNQKDKQNNQNNIKNNNQNNTQSNIKNTNQNTNQNAITNNISNTSNNISNNASKNTPFYANYKTTFAIYNKCPDDDCFLSIKEDAYNEFNGEFILPTEATKYIKSLDLRDILDIHISLNNSIHSLFYHDIHPSDSFCQKDTYSPSYYCRRDGEYYNNIFEIIARIFYPNKTLTSNEWSQIYRFAYQMFGLNIIYNVDYQAIKQQFNQIRVDNINAFKSIISYSKQTKYLKAYIDLYQLIMDLWAEHVNKYNIPYDKAYRDLSADWLSQELKKQNINKDRRWICRGLMILSSINILERIEGLYIPKKWIPETKSKRGNCINRYTFPNITNNLETIITKAEIIRSHFDKPSIQVSMQKLDEIMLDYHIQNAFNKFK